VHGLEAVDNVLLVVVGVLFKVSLRNVLAEVVQHLCRDMELAQQIIVLEELRDHERQRCIHHHRAEAEAVELYLIKVLQSLIKLVLSEVLQVSQDKELLVWIILLALLDLSSSFL